MAYGDTCGKWKMCFPKQVDNGACTCPELMQADMNSIIMYRSYLGYNPFSSITLDSQRGTVGTGDVFLYEPNPTDGGYWDHNGPLGWLIWNVPQNQGGRYFGYWPVHDMLRNVEAVTPTKVIDEVSGSFTASGWKTEAPYQQSPGTMGDGTPYVKDRVNYHCETPNLSEGENFNGVFFNAGLHSTSYPVFVGSGADYTIEQRNFSNPRCTTKWGTLYQGNLGDTVTSQQRDDADGDPDDCKNAYLLPAIGGTAGAKILSEGLVAECSISINGTSYDLGKRTPEFASDTVRWRWRYYIWGMVNTNLAPGMQPNGPLWDGTYNELNGDTNPPNPGRDQAVAIFVDYAVQFGANNSATITCGQDIRAAFLDYDEVWTAPVRFPPGEPLYRRANYTTDSTPHQPVPPIIDNTYPNFTGRQSGDLSGSAALWQRCDSTTGSGELFGNSDGLGGGESVIYPFGSVDFQFSFSNNL